MGSITLAAFNTSDTNVNLTTLDAAGSDHAFFSVGWSPSSRKNGGGSLISSLVELVSSAWNNYTGSPRTISATNDTPTANFSSDGGIYFGNLNNGYNTTVYGEIATRKVRVYGARYSGGDTYTFTLSDGSASPVSYTFPNTGGGTTGRDYIEVDFAGNSNGVTLQVQGKFTTDQGSGNVAIQAIHLGAPTSSAAALAANAADVASATVGLSTGIKVIGASIVVTTVTGNITNKITYNGAALTVTTGTGQISTQTRFNATAADITTANAGITTAIKPAGNAAGNVNAGGQLATGINPAANAVNVVTGAGSISTAINMIGSASVIVNAIGNPTMQVLIKGDAMSQALAAAGFDSGIFLNGTAQDYVNVTVGLTAWIRAAANAQDNAAATGGLSTGIRPAANALDTVISTVTLNTQILYSGSPQAVSAAVASLMGSATQFNANAADIVKATADLTVGGNVAGNAQDVVTVVVNLTTKVNLNVANVVQAIVTGEFTTYIRMDGFAADQSAGAGTLSNAPTVIPFRFKSKSKVAVPMSSVARAATIMTSEVRLAA